MPTAGTRSACAGRQCGAIPAVLVADWLVPAQRQAAHQRALVVEPTGRIVKAAL